MQQPLNRPKQLITKQYRRKVRRPQNHRPIPRSVTPKVRGHGEKLHKRQSKHPCKSQKNLLFNFFSTLTPAPDDKQNSPRNEKRKEQHIPARVEIKDHVHAAIQTRSCYKNILHFDTPRLRRGFRFFQHAWQ